MNIAERALEFAEIHRKRHKLNLEILKGADADKESLEIAEDIVAEAEFILKAVEKQIPSNVLLYGDPEDGKMPCPSCNEDLWDLKECGFDYCPYCGQALKWEE